MKKREIAAWIVALPLAIWGAVCMPLVTLGGSWVIVLPLAFFAGSISFVLLNLLEKVEE